MSPTIASASRAGLIRSPRWPGSTFTELRLPRMRSGMGFRHPLLRWMGHAGRHGRWQGGGFQIHTAVVVFRGGGGRCVESREAPSPVRRSEPPRPRNRGGPQRRHESVQCLGRVCRRVLPDPAGPFWKHEGARAELKGLRAGRCQGGRRAWHSGQAVEIRGMSFRYPEPRRRQTRAPL